MARLLLITDGDGSTSGEAMLVFFFLKARSGRLGNAGELLIAHIAGGQAPRALEIPASPLTGCQCTNRKSGRLNYDVT